MTFTRTLALFTGIVLFSGCKNPKDNMPIAVTDQQDGTVNEADTNHRYLAERNAYRNEAFKKTDANDRVIAALSRELGGRKNKAGKLYGKRIDELDNMNTELQQKMEQQKIEGSKKWAAFKKSYNEDMMVMNASLDFMKTESDKNGRAK